MAQVGVLTAQLLGRSARRNIWLLNCAPYAVFERVLLSRRPEIFAAATSLARGARRWIFHLGALAFIPLGLLDNSVVPVPGSMDVLTIALSARHEQLWLYYALMATAGSVAGGFATYKLAFKGGREAFAGRLRRRHLERASKIFERWGFGAIAIPALLPPPVPMVPFLIAAGAMQYSAKKFLAALTLGRVVRYMLLAMLAARYGRRTLAFFSQHGQVALWAAIGLTTIAVVVLVALFVNRFRKRAAS